MTRSAEHDRDELAALIRSAGPRPVPPTEDYQVVLAAATEAWRNKVRKRRRNRWALAAAAGIAIVAITLVSLLSQLPQSGAGAATALIARGGVAVLLPGAADWSTLAEDPATLAAGTRLRTGADGRLALLLGAAVELRVDGSTEIQLTAADRVSLAAGTIYVDSGADGQAGNFRVTTPFGELRDIGTQFEVSAAATALRLRVREGRVVLNQDGLRLDSEAGQQLTVDGTGQVTRTAFRTDDSAWGWVEQLATPPDVEGRTLREFLTWVGRQTGRSVRFAEPAAELRARSVRLHATVSLRGLTPIEALDTVLATTRFNYIIQDDGAILVGRR